MAENNSEEAKQYPPTERRKEDAIRRGNVLVSKEIYNLCFLLAFAVLLFCVLPFLVRYLLFSHLRSFIIQACERSVPIASSWVISTLLLILGVIYLPPLLLCLFGNFLHHGRFLLNWHLLSIDFSRISPAAGIKRIFSSATLVDLAKSLAKAGLVLAILFSILSRVISAPELYLVHHSVGDAFKLGSALTKELLWKVLVFVAVLALADYLFQSARYTRSLYMSKKELVDEHKELEGNPEVKRRIRRKLLQKFRSDLGRFVSLSSYVIKDNDDYIAICVGTLSKEEGVSVLWKGSGNQASRLLSTASSYGVTVFTEHKLAQDLYYSTFTGPFTEGDSSKKLYELLFAVQPS